MWGAFHVDHPNDCAGIFDNFGGCVPCTAAPCCICIQTPRKMLELQGSSLVQVDKQASKLVLAHYNPKP